MSTFGQTDTGSIVLSIKSPKKSPDKPPKYGTALVPFKQIGDAFAAVCASGKRERGLEGIEVGWVGGKEPLIFAWLKKMGKLGSPPTTSRDGREEGLGKENAGAGLPQMQTTTNSSSYSSFPASFPDLPTPSSKPQVMPGGIDYESLTLMRLRLAERERLEREIREQEAND